MALDSRLVGDRTFVIRAKHWRRGPAEFDRVSGQIILDVSRAELYVPVHDDSALLFELAAITEPSDAVAFVQRRGLLMHGPDDDVAREPFDDIRDEAASLWLLMRLYELIARAWRGEREAAREVRDLWLPKFVESIHEESGEVVEVPGAPDAAVETAAQLLALAVSSRVENVEQGVTTAGESFEHYAWTRNMIDGVYVDFANMICTSVPMAVCPECGRVFVVEHGRQRFCSKTCSGRARNRRWRKGGDATWESEQRTKAASSSEKTADGSRKSRSTTKTAGASGARSTSPRRGKRERS